MGSVYPVALCLRLPKLSFIHISVLVDESAHAIELVVDELALVDRSVGPDLFASSELLALVPLAEVDWAVGEFVGAKVGKSREVFKLIFLEIKVTKLL